MNLDLKNPAGQESNLFAEEVQKISPKIEGSSLQAQHVAGPGQKVHFAPVQSQQAPAASTLSRQENAGLLRTVPEQQHVPDHAALAQEVSSTSLVFAAQNVTGFTCRLVPGPVPVHLVGKSLPRSRGSSPLNLPYSGKMYGSSAQSHVWRSSLTPAEVSSLLVSLADVGMLDRQIILELPKLQGVAFISRDAALQVHLDAFPTCCASLCATSYARIMKVSTGAAEDENTCLVRAFKQHQLDCLVIAVNCCPRAMSISCTCCSTAPQLSSGVPVWGSRKSHRYRNPNQ